MLSVYLKVEQASVRFFQLCSLIARNTDCVPIAISVNTDLCVKLV